MGIPVNPNWLVLLGLAYASVGVLLIAAGVSLSLGMAAATSSARERAARSNGALVGLGAAVVILGLLFQAAAQFHAMPLNGYIVTALAGLIGGLAVFALIDPVASWSDGDPMRATSGSEPERQVPPPASGTETAPVKLVAATG